MYEDQDKSVLVILGGLNEPYFFKTVFIVEGGVKKL
jgi:hypothetical protein